MADALNKGLTYSTSSLVRRVWREHLSRYRAQLAMAVGCMLVSAMATGLNAWIIGPTLDKIFIEKDPSMTTIIPLAIFAIGVTSAAANYGNVYFMRFVGQRIVADMQTRLFAHLIKSDIGLFNQQSSGRLVSRFTNDINLLRNAFSNVLTALAKGTLTTAFLVGLMIYQSPQLAAIALVAFPFAIYPLLRLGKRMRKVSDKTQTQLGDFTVTLDEIFQGVRTVKSYNREAFEARRAGSIIEKLSALYLKSARIQAAASPMMEVLSGFSIALVFWYGGTQVLNGETTPGAFTSFLGAFLMAYKPVRSMSGMNSTLQEGVAAAGRLFAVLDTPPAITSAPDAQELRLTGGHIRFEQVSFQYANLGGGVNEVSLDVPAGKTAALVGLSGSGKSTLVNLLLRFYDAQSGTISIDGQDIRQLTLSSLRNAMGFVPQECMLFDDTVRANIAYGREDASEEEIIEAAKNAAADDFIRALPQGYDTMIGSHGVLLSGGQRQRLAIARAILKNAPILLLDEATSSLDNESERSIQQALAKLMKGRTTLVVAHRLSTIVSADIIYVIDGGKVIESGTHDTLLSAGGKYHQLYSQSVDSIGD
jgi:subfamily B ATP-binding cassette protein MsbA